MTRASYSFCLISSLLLSWSLDRGVSAFSTLTKPTPVAFRHTQQRTIDSLSVSSVRTKSPTRLFQSSSPSSDTADTSATINWALIAQNLANQALIGATIWTGGAQYQTLQANAQFTVFAVLLGVFGVLPLLYLSRKIESSESYLVSGLNLSTNMAVMRLFGATPQPVTAFVLSALMAGVTGLVEETTFRGQLIPAFASTFGGGDVMTGAVLSTLLFALLHTNPLSLIRGKGEVLLDNWVLLFLQIINGGFFALLYLTTGNLAVAIVAHALYDLYTFYKTHMVEVAGQMQYANDIFATPLSGASAIERKWQQARGDDFVRNVKQSFYLMDTNRDGMLQRNELRVALYSYGINLNVQQSQRLTQLADLDQSGAIDLDEFLEFVGPTGSTGKAVRNTLFGPL